MFGNLEDSLEEFDIRYIEACNQVNEADVTGNESANISASTASTYACAGTADAASFGKATICRSNLISSQTKKLTLSSPLLANKELSNFRCYDKKQTETAKTALDVPVSPTCTQPVGSYEVPVAQLKLLINSVPPRPPPILTIDAFQKPFEFRSHSLSTSPQVNQRRSKISSSNTSSLSSSSSILQPPQFRRRATYSSGSSVGNPFYKPSIVHKKDPDLHRPSTLSSSPSNSNKNSITSTLLDDSTLNSLFEGDFLATSIQKKRKVSSDTFSLESFFTSEITLEEEYGSDFQFYQEPAELSTLAKDN